MCVKCESCAITKAIEHAPSRSLSVGERDEEREREECLEHDFGPTIRSSLS